MNSPYVFPRLWTFINRIATSRNTAYLDQSRGLWHCNQVQGALEQVPRLDRDSQIALINHAIKIRESLATVLEGMDAAILEVTREFDLDNKRANL